MNRAQSLNGASARSFSWWVAHNPVIAVQAFKPRFCPDNSAGAPLQDAIVDLLEARAKPMSAPQIYEALRHSAPSVRSGIAILCRKGKVKKCGYRGRYRYALAR